MTEPRIDLEGAVQERYSRAAAAPETKLCCAVNYDPRYLEAIPREVLDRDYGCGDPTRHLRPGETVLDLGSGSGKACFIAAQVVGAAGRVLGVDANDDMLALAERNRPIVAERVGFDNVRFVKARIQDLALDLRRLGQRLAERPVTNPAELEALERWMADERRERPLVATDSVDVVVSNCVLNLVRPEDKAEMFGEIHRVLRSGGRAVISDIVCDEEVPQALADDPELWSGCISGAFREDRFIEAFERAGFYGMRLLARDAEPWQVVAGIEFRSITVEAFKGKEGPCLERQQAVVYRGPWSSVTDDDGHTLFRGQRMAVCDKTYGIFTREPYAGEIEAIRPRVDLPPDQATPYDCGRDTIRHPRETKGQGSVDTSRRAGSRCGPEDGCCG